MDVGRLCGVFGAEGHAHHQLVDPNVKAFCERYPGMGFTSREEWVGEQTIQALRRLLADCSCTDAERKAIEEFLALAAEQLPGVP